ncbi:MaoC/PaaZ C-terminal domain-containing protein [Devosia algicola]|uniref:MaoC/PaaZ C-terminal domain-containing protein n=1 Tax=Devosia algicola TaxID=3026418 RepID=A0ABY7YSA6_9HYPH|nr:MaoC/PaaZ C-terminal domain-containing protein [Devosia algicola]WDR03925.1 MaoC/PaaZ C-terminal domain-containing protein [Devosia algicola]
MEHERYFEDYVLDHTRTTFGRTITESDFVVHAGHTGDFFPHHMDAEAMKSSQWGQRIAHGTLTFAIGIGLTATEINPLAFSYGYDRLRFPKPVFIGDTIHTQLRIARLEDDPKRLDHGRITEEVRVINQRDDVVLACDHIYLAKRRNPT